MTSSEENPFNTSHLNEQQQQHNSLFLRGLQYVDVDKDENVVITRPDNTIEMNYYMQIVFACSFVLIFCLMICLSLRGRHAHTIRSSPEARERRRRRRANESLPPKMDPEQRKELVSKSLVIKHVMGAEEYEKYLEEKLKTHSHGEDSSHSSDEDNAENDYGEDSLAETTKPATTMDTALLPTDSSTEKDKNNEKNKDDTKDSNSNKHAYRRLKSNLVVSSQDDLDAARDSRDEAWMCAICLMEFELGDEICWSHNPNCRHVFHHECIEAWLMKHDDCPCCRHNYLAPTSSDSERSTSSSSGDENGDDRDHANTDSTSTHQSDYDYRDIESSGRPQRHREVDRFVTTMMYPVDHPDEGTTVYNGHEQEI